MLRDPTRADAAPYAQAFADDPDLARDIGFDAPSESRMRKTFAAEDRDRARGEVVRLVVSDALDAFHGLVLLHSFSWENLRADVGIMLAPASRGAGRALDGVRLIVRWAFRDLRLQRVGLATLPGNAATIAVAERAGFVREGVLRAYTREWGRPTDNAIFSAVPGDPAWA